MEFSFSYWFLQSLAMMITALLIPRLEITNPLGAFLAVIALGFVNASVWNAALFFSVPNSLTSQTLLLFAANGVLFWIIVKIIPWIDVEGFLPALAAPVVFTLCSLMISHYGQDVDWAELSKKLIAGIEGFRDYLLSESASGGAPVNNGAAQ